MPWPVALAKIPGLGLVLGPVASIASNVLDKVGVQPAIMMILPPGAFILMGTLMGFFQWRKLCKEAGQ